MSVFTNAKMIGLDWGTTSFRAFLIDQDGHVLDQKTNENGILAVPNNDFKGVLISAIKVWLDQHPALPIVASGMITSRNGWHETPYLSLPANINDFANALTPLTLSNDIVIHFITGASYENENGVPDIMRGEETQIIGEVEASDNEIFLLPGTHSKWAITQDEKIIGFTSFMTGEVYAVLKEHTILGALMKECSSLNDDAFLKGVLMQQKQDISILHQIFTARTLALFDKLENEDIADYLSGLLIGEEIKSALNQYDANKETIIKIIGRGDLAARYARALDAFGLNHKIINDEVTAMGHYKIAKKAGLLK